MTTATHSNLILTATNVRPSEFIGYEHGVDIDVTINGVHYGATLLPDHTCAYRITDHQWLAGPNDQDLDDDLMDAIASLCEMAANVEEVR